MNLTVEIPDEIATRLSAHGGEDLLRRAREAFLAEEYRHGRLTKPELQQLRYRNQLSTRRLSQGA